MSESKKLSFNSKSPEGEILLRWWTALQQDKGARARLRRCASPEEVMMEPAFHHLLNLMRPVVNGGNEGYANDSAYTGLAAIVGLLAHVEEFDKEKLARQMAGTGGRPLLSSLRFRRLLKSSREQLYPAMIRVLRMFKRRASIFDVANSVLYWGDNVRKRWAMDYFPNVTEK